MLCVKLGGLFFVFSLICLYREDLPYVKIGDMLRAMEVEKIINSMEPWDIKVTNKD